MERFSKIAFYFPIRIALLLGILGLGMISQPVSAQTYYPKIEFLQSNLIAYPLDKSGGYFLIRKRLTGFSFDTVSISIQKFGPNGELVEFNKTNSIKLYTQDSPLISVHFLCINPVNMDPHSFKEILLTPGYIENGTVTSRPIMIKFDPSSRQMDTLPVSWNFQNYAVYNGLRVDSLYFFEIAENNNNDSLRKYYLVKTDINLNIISKFPYWGIVSHTVQLNYWRKFIYLFGGAFIYEPDIQMDKMYPALFLYHPEPVSFFYGKTFKTKLDGFDWAEVSFYDLFSFGDSLLVGLSENWNGDQKLVMVMDSLLTRIDSFTYLPNGYYQSTLKDGNHLLGVAWDEAKMDTSYYDYYYYFDIDISKRSVKYHTLNLGLKSWSLLYITKIGDTIFLYGNLRKFDEFGMPLYTPFRVSLDKFGVPFELRDSTTSTQEKTKEDLGFQVYPNPGNGLFSIDLKGIYGPCTLTVTDIFGRTIHTQEVNHLDNYISLNYRPGIYYITIHSGSMQSKSKKVMVTE